MNKLIFGDCIEKLEELEDLSIDLMLTDPPYLTTDLTFDKKGFNVDDFVKVAIQKIKSNGYLISFGSIELLGKISNYLTIRWSGVWVKPCGVMRTATARKPRSQSELYAVYAMPNHKIRELTFNKIKTYGHPKYKKKQRYRGCKDNRKDSLARASASAWTRDGYVIENDGSRYVTDVLTGPAKNQMKHSERTPHPTQKPIEILEKLIRFCSNEGDLIVDPFMGSGSTGIACINTNRNFIGIEVDECYYNVAVDRIENYRNNKGICYDKVNNRNPTNSSLNKMQLELNFQ